MAAKEKQFSSNATWFDRFRRPIMLVIILVILIIGYFVVLEEPIRAYQRNYSLLNKLNNDIHVAQGDLAIAQNFAGKVYRLTPLESKLLNMALPAKSDDSSIVAQLTSLIQRSGFTASNIDISETTRANGLKSDADQIGRISIRLKLKDGGYSELKQLLKLMETSLMMIDVHSINFTVKSPVYDLALITYYYNPAGVK